MSSAAGGCERGRNALIGRTKVGRKAHVMSEGVDSGPNKTEKNINKNPAFLFLLLAVAVIVCAAAFVLYLTSTRHRLFIFLENLL